MRRSGGARKSSDTPGWMRALAIVGGLLIGVGIGAGILLLTSKSDISLAVKILVPLALIGLGIAAVYVPKAVGRKDRGVKREAEVSSLKAIDIAYLASLLRIEGLEPREALEEAAGRIGQLEQEAVRGYLSDGTGLLRTSPDRDLVEMILSGTDPLEVKRSCEGRMAERAGGKASMGPVAIALVISAIAIALLAAGMG